MSATEDNRRRIAVLLQEAYDLTAEDVERALKAAERVERGEIRYTLMHKMTGRNLQVEPLDYPAR